MKEYQPLTIKKFSKKSYKSTELKRLKKFKQDKAMDLKHTASSIKICESHSNIVTFFAFDKIFHFDLISENTNEKYPQLTDVITAGNLRKDGKIIFTGLANGVVNIYDAGKKLCLRSYSGYHKLQVNSIDISDNLTNFVTSSNDLSFKIFETSRLEPIYSFDKAHSDYINIAKFVDENLIISGGNDKIIKLWDLRSCSGKTKFKPVLTFDNININNDILILNSHNKFISTSENNLNLFDLRSDKIVHQINPMQSIIKKIVPDFTKSRLFAVPQGENFVKCIELGKEETPSMKSLFSLKFPKEISAFDISGDMNRYAVGFVDGEMQIKSRNVEEEDEEIYKDQEDKDLEYLDPSKYAEKTVVKNYKYFTRGQYEDNIEANEITLPKGKKKKLQDYDFYLKKFQYHLALDSVLQKKNVELTITVLEELIDRNALKLAILNRSEEDLEILLNFILWKIRDPKTMNILIYVFNLLIEYYMFTFGKSDKIDSLFLKIKDAISEEISFQMKMKEIGTNIESIENLYKLYNDKNE